MICFKDGEQYHVKDMNKEDEQLRVNFPAPGLYYANCNLYGIKRTGLVRFPSPDLPTPDRDHRRPFTVRFNGSVQGPAQIYALPHPDYKEKTVIEVGPMFRAMPFQVQQFVLFHEEGHFLYSSETGADMYALKKFLDKGYNPSQAVVALEKYLSYSRENTRRIFDLYNTVKTLMK